MASSAYFITLDDVDAEKYGISAITSNLLLIHFSNKLLVIADIPYFFNIPIL